MDEAALDGAVYSLANQEEKRKDYRNVVTFQLGLLVLSLFSDDWMGDRPLNFFLFQVCAAIYLGLLWDLSRNFTFKRWVPNSIGAMALTVILGSLFNNYLFWNPDWGSGVNALFHAITVGIQSFVTWLGLRDLIRGPRRASDKLWAATGLYLMLGIAWAELIHLVHLILPATLPDTPASVQGFHEALYLSFVTLTGADNELKSISHFCRNLLALEALMAQLYMVMLISRLFVSDESAPGAPGSEVPSSGIQHPVG